MEYLEIHPKKITSKIGTHNFKVHRSTPKKKEIETCSFRVPSNYTRKQITHTTQNK
jgi:hypothetical protein